ncbi:MAG: GAF and ANTAR domain-containing protein [Acidimicrobiales bacterium]
MSDERSKRLAVAFAQEAARSPEARLCSACVRALDVSGVAITVMSAHHSGPVCVSNARVSDLANVQFTLGQGPCQEAFETGVPVLVPTFDGAAAARWPAFVALAAERGVYAMFAYPLETRRSTVGVLSIYQDRAGPLDETQLEDAPVVAEIVARTILAMQAASPPGALPVDLDQAVAHRAEVHQASGVLSVQLQVPVAEAMARIRAFSYAQGEDVDKVAANIVAHRVRLPNSDDDPDGKD